MNDPVPWIALCVGLALGALLAWLWKSSREQATRVELAVLRERAKSDDELRAQLRSVFGDLATDSLKNNNELFLQTARERLGRQQQETMQSVGSLVEPIRTALARTEAQIGEIEKERLSAFTSLKTQIEALNQGQSLLSRETRNLVTALRRPEVRGQWGEITLRRLVELSGMSEHVDFSEQPSLTTAGGTIRPDMIVHMPDARDIVIDVKTPLDAYLAAVEAADDTERGAHLKRHAQNVAARVRELSSKQYWSQFERSPDFVVLFLPGDQFLSAALQDSYALMDEAMRVNVIFATPSSLVALLKTVAFGWKQSALAQNADEVRRLGEEIYRRLSTFGEHLAKLGKSLGGSVDSYNKAVGSLEQSVLPAARRFPELGLRVDRAIDALDPIATLARTPRAPNPEDEHDERK